MNVKRDPRLVHNVRPASALEPGKVTVRVAVERHVRDEAARQLAEQGLTIGETVHIVLEQAAAGCGPDFGALVPNPTTVEAIEAARRGEVVELGTPEEAITELNRDD